LLSFPPSRHTQKLLLPPFIPHFRYSINLIAYLQRRRCEIVSMYSNFAPLDALFFAILFVFKKLKKMKFVHNTIETGKGGERTTKIFDIFLSYKLNVFHFISSRLLLAVDDEDNKYFWRKLHTSNIFHPFVRLHVL
jgi:hypothetical protein